MKKLLYIGTHPSQTNGYSKVVYNHLRELSKISGLYVVCYGIQHAPSSNERSIMSDNIHVHKASSAQNGFAFDELKDFMKVCTPDAVFIYNDPYVCSQYLRVLEGFACKKLVYLDLVYIHMKTALIEYVVNEAHTLYVFDNSTKQAYKFNTAKVLPHGIHSDDMQIVTKQQACNELNINSDFIYVLNMNRNQPRKRYDVFVKAVVAFYKKYNMRNVKFILATQIKGAFDLFQIFCDECNQKDICLQFTEVFVIVENPQALSDKHVNLLYNAADIGINTCDGEGWGLCNFEHMAYGKPQVIPAHPAFLNYCNEENSQCIKPKWSYCVDSTRDANGGEAFVVEPDDVAEAIYKYACDDAMRLEHGRCACSDVSAFKWNLKQVAEDVLAIDE